MPEYLKHPSKPVKFGGISYVLVYTGHAAAHLLQRYWAIRITGTYIGDFLKKAYVL